MQIKIHTTAVKQNIFAITMKAADEYASVSLC